MAEISDEAKRTIELLAEAGNRAESLSLLNGLDPDEYFEAMGLVDDDAVQLYVDHHIREIVRASVFMDAVDIRSLMGTAMLFGMSVGYQMALMREEKE